MADKYLNILIRRLLSKRKRNTKNSKTVFAPKGGRKRRKTDSTQKVGQSRQSSRKSRREYYGHNWFLLFWVWYGYVFGMANTFLWGAVLGIFGFVLMALAYPVFNKILKSARKNIQSKF